VRAVVVRRRLDFLFEPGDRLVLISENPQAGPPNYDLALVAERVLSSPAEPASLSDVTHVAQTNARAPRWFWFFVLGAAVILFVAVGRVLRPTPSGAE
jgi:hypothetical protein